MNTEELSIIVSVQDIVKFESYLFERENAEATIQKYKTDIRTFFCFLQRRREINKRILLQYKEWLISKYAISSVNSILAALNQFLDFLGAGYLKIKRVKIQKSLFLKEEKELTKAEFQKLIRSAKLEGKEQLALCMETIAATGIRISELKYFTVEQVKKGKIEIFNKGKYRRIFLPDLIRRKLLVFSKKNRIKKGSIFITRNGKPKDRSNIWSEMKALKEKSGVEAKKIFPHNLRHLFARNYYQYTKDLTGLADILGHSSLNVTRIYTSNTGRIYQKQLDEMMRLRI